jgi:hypothetical protein
MGPSAGSPRRSSSVAPAPLRGRRVRRGLRRCEQALCQTRRIDYIAKAERETDPERKLHLLKAAEDYGPGGRYADCVGGGVRLVNKPGCDAFKAYATDIEYLYDVTRKGNLLHIVAYSTSERDGSWAITRIFSGSLARMQAQYALKYL